MTWAVSDNGSTVALQATSGSSILPRSTMKDAFGKELELGSKVLYSTGSGGGTVYHVGEVTKLHDKKNEYKTWNPERVTVKILKSDSKFTRDPIVYASNVVLLPVEITG